jgi:GT2 family glycosyltransferase
MVQPFSEYRAVAGVQTLAKAKPDDPDILKKVHSKFEYKNKIIDIEHYEPVGTSHLLIRKDLIMEAGGFKDISFKEDTDLTHTIMRMGYKFVYLPDEKCYHYHVKNYRDYVRKEIRNKYRGFICLLKGIK